MRFFFSLWLALMLGVVGADQTQAADRNVVISSTSTQSSSAGAHDPSDPDEGEDEEGEESALSSLIENFDQLVEIAQQYAEEFKAEADYKDIYRATNEKIALHINQDLILYILKKLSQSTGEEEEDLGELDDLEGEEDLLEDSGFMEMLKNFKQLSLTYYTGKKNPKERRFEIALYLNHSLAIPIGDQERVRRHQVNRIMIPTAMIYDIKYDDKKQMVKIHAKSPRVRHALRLHSHGPAGHVWLREVNIDINKKTAHLNMGIWGNTIELHANARMDENNQIKSSVDTGKTLRGNSTNILLLIFGPILLF